MDWAEQAVEMAEKHLEFDAFSRTGFIELLEYEGFSTEHATAAVDAVTQDWNEQAAAKAQSYLESRSWSPGDLMDQLLVDGFTEAQAQYGVDQTGL